MEKSVSLFVPTKRENMSQAKNKGKGKIPPQCGIKKESKCFFCKKKGHMKKDCTMFLIYLENKGKSISPVSYESNIVDVIYKTWWNDSGSTIHVLNTFQGMTSLGKLLPSEQEQGIYLGSKMRFHVEVVGTCNLVLSNGFVLNLEKTFYFPSFSRNLISISILVPLGYSFNFYETPFYLFYKY